MTAVSRSFLILYIFESVLKLTSESKRCLRRITENDIDKAYQSVVQGAVFSRMCSSPPPPPALISLTGSLIVILKYYLTVSADENEYPDIWIRIYLSPATSPQVSLSLSL